MLLSTLPEGELEVSILRLSNVIGTGDSGRVIPLWIDAATEGRPIEIYGGDQELDFVPIATVSRAIRRLLESGPVGGPVNIGSGRSTSLRDLSVRVLEMFPSATVEVLPPRGPEVTRYCADITRMRSCLGIEPPSDPLADIASYGSGS
jgi:nucleoside-diphosphate-sugar epimerase